MRVCIPYPSSSLFEPTLRSQLCYLSPVRHIPARLGRSVDGRSVGMGGMGGMVGGPSLAVRLARQAQHMSDPGTQRRSTIFPSLSTAAPARG